MLIPKCAHDGVYRIPIQDRHIRLLLARKANLLVGNAGCLQFILGSSRC
ncbi:hypothetical protein [Polaromonas sp. YR568]